MEGKSIREAEFNHQFSVNYKSPCFSNLKPSQYILLFFQQSAYLTRRNRMQGNCAVIHKVNSFIPSYIDVGTHHSFFAEKKCLALISFNFHIDFCVVLY